MSECDHRNQTMRWESDEIIHSCRICHLVWSTPRDLKADDKHD